MTNQVFQDNTFLVRCLVVVLLSIFSLSAFSIQPSAQQLEQFKRLSPSEQAQLAKQFGVTIPQADQTTNQTVVQETSVLPRDLSAQNTTHKNSTTLGTFGEADKDKDKDKDKEVELKPYGYDLFAGNPTSFTPINDIPVSSDYVLGAGDSLKVNLYGKANQSYELVIDQEGRVYLPDLGPLSLAGLNFAEAKKQLVNTIDQKMIGVTTSVSMGQLRSIRVFVLGEAYLPGSYVVSSLSTMTNALVLSGGISENGSLRNIQLKRKGELIQTLDIYDLLLKGDTRNDAQLKSGDVVFIPPVGPTVSITGEIRRAARYELKGAEKAQQVINYAGGMLSSAYPRLATLQRIDHNNERTLLNIDLKMPQGLETVLQNGDLISIPKVLKKIENVVKLTGHVIRDETVTWRPNLRITDVIPEVERLKANPDLNYALIKRYRLPSRELEVLSFSLAKALKAPKSADDPVLQDQDEIVFFGLYGSSRQDEITKLIGSLRAQATTQSPSKEISISGDVRYPGDYPLVTNMQVDDLISAAGGLTEKAFQLRAELSRTEYDSKQERNQYRVALDLSKSDSLNFALKSRDVLQIKTIPNWQDFAQITLKGEVKFPGVYPIYKDDTLAMVLTRAGGLTEYAFPEGAMFTRVALQKQQAKQLQEMQDRLAEDIAKAQVISSNSSASTNSANAPTGDVGQAQKLLSQLKATAATGRLVVDLDKVMAHDPHYAIPLQNGDALYIPTKKNSVTIIGEVQQPTSQIFEPSLGYLDYIQRSGGVTNKSDDDHIYIIKANGAVKIPESSGWFASSDNQSLIAPGDTIVVPLNADKVDQVVLWKDLSQIMYQIALGAAAVTRL